MILSIEAWSKSKLNFQQQRLYSLVYIYINTAVMELQKLQFLLFMCEFGVMELISILTQPQNETVKSGETVVMPCKFDGPAESCIWMIDKMPCIASERYRIGDTSAGDCSLRISESNAKSDEGWWQCLIPEDSEKMEVYSNAVFLTVYDPPTEPYIYIDGIKQKNGSVFLMTGSDSSQHNLTCQSDKGRWTAPSLKFMWNNVSLDPLPTNTFMNLDDQKIVTILTAWKSWSGLPYVNNLKCQQNYLHFETMTYVEFRRDDTSTVITTTPAAATPNLKQDTHATSGINYDDKWTISKLAIDLIMVMTSNVFLYSYFTQWF